MGYRDQDSHLCSVQSHFFNLRDIMSNLLRNFEVFHAQTNPHDNPDLGNKRHEFCSTLKMFVINFSGTEFNCSNNMK